VGQGFAELTGGLPLALGVNAIRRGLGPETVAKVARLCRTSIAWALEHRERMMDALLDRETRGDVALDRALLDRYLAMYANADTLALADDTRRGLVELFRRAPRRGPPRARARGRGRRLTVSVCVIAERACGARLSGEDLFGPSGNVG
jgi:1,4-dihydroxy-6-naphthoate synthase